MGQFQIDFDILLYVVRGTYIIRFRTRPIKIVALTRHCILEQIDSTSGSGLHFRHRYGNMILRTRVIRLLITTNYVISNSG